MVLFVVRVVLFCGASSVVDVGGGAIAAAVVRIGGGAV